MSGNRVIGVCGVGVLALSGALAHAENLELRLGAWEVTTRLNGVGRPAVLRACITKADLTPFVHGPDTIEDDPCAPKGPARAGRRTWSQSLSCQDGSQMHVEFVAERPDAITGTLLRIGGRNTLVQRTQIAGRWLGGNCKGVR